MRNKAKCIDILMIIKNVNKTANTPLFGGNEAHYTTQIFNGTNLHVAYKTKYTTQTIVRPKHSLIKQNIYNHSGIYQLTYLVCDKKYTADMERNF
jgi:hypothetical protein